MKLLTIGTDRKIFEEKSSVRERMIEYGKLFEELHIVVFTTRIMDYVRLDDRIGRGSRIKLSENVFAYPTNSKNKLFCLLDAFKLSKSIIHDSKFIIKDSVISSQDPFETGIVGLFLKIIYKLPLQIQIHTEFSSKHFILHPPLNIIRFMVWHVVLSFADSVRVVSKKIASHVHIDPEYLSVLPISLNREFTIKDYEKENKEKVVFLTVARLEKEKDLETAIKAFKKVTEEVVNSEFIIVGDGSQRKSLEFMAKNLEIIDRIRFAGWQTDTRKYFEEADVYVSTSLYEGYGVSMMEAASFKMPLIVSDTGVAGEILKDGEEAIILKPKDVEGFGNAMIKLSKDFELRKIMGEKAQIAARKSSISHEEYLQKFKHSIEQALVHNSKNYSIFKKNILVRYLSSGFTGAGTQIGLLYVFTDFARIWYIYSSLIAFAVAVIVSFILQKTWTFNNRSVTVAHHQFGRFFAIAIVGACVNTLALFVLVDFLKLWYVFGQIIAGAGIAVFNFLMYKFFVFKK